MIINQKYRIILCTNGKIFWTFSVDNKEEAEEIKKMPQFVKFITGWRSFRAVVT